MRATKTSHNGLNREKMAKDKPGSRKEWLEARLHHSEEGRKESKIKMRRVPPVIAISGSFHRHFSAILDTKARFENLGVTVLSPAGRTLLDPATEFPLLAEDDSDNPAVLQKRHLDAITAADALYVVNPESYLGKSVAFEMGWAAAHSKPIYSQNPLREPGLQSFVAASVVAEEAARLLLNLPAA
jgi:hypothetical protein